MQRVALLNGKNKNKDFDLSKIFESFGTPGVSKGLDFSSGYITPGFAFVEVEREGKKFVVLFENTENFPIDTNGTKKVFIEISQDKILDGSRNNVDGTGIGHIKTASEYPSKNFIKLGRIEHGAFYSEKVKISLKEEYNLTKMGNTFNSGGKLVKLENNGKLPILDGSNLTNIRTDNFNFSIDYIAGENISGNNFVRRGNNRKITIDGPLTYAPHGQGERNIQEKLYIKKIPRFFYEIQLLGYSSGYSGMKFVFYKNSNFTDKLAESTSLNYEYISSGNKHIYKFGNFNIFDKDFIIENKIIYWRVEGNNNASFYYSYEAPESEYFNFNGYQEKTYLYKFIFGKNENEDEGKVYKAISKYSLENEDIIGFVKNGGNNNQNIRVITDGYIDGQNIPLNQRNVFLGKNGGVTQENTGVKIGEKVNNNIFKFTR